MLNTNDTIPAGTASLNSGNLLDKAVEFHQKGQLQIAERICREVLVVNPHVAAAIHLLGVIAYQRGEIDAAIELIDQAIVIDPQKSSYYNNLGNAYFSKNEHDAAVKYYRKALEYKPDDMEVNENLGNVLLLQGRREEAKACYHNVLKVKPDHALVCKRLADIHVKQKDLDSAISYYMRAVEIKPDYYEAYDYLAYALERSNRIEEAMRIITTRIEMDPDNPTTNLVFAKCESRSGSVENAITRLKKSLNRDSGFHSQEIHYELGRLYDQIQAHDLAFEHLSRANQLAEKTIDKAKYNNDYFKEIECLSNQFSDAWVKSWTSHPAENTGAPVFLVGFHRSGTTLLGQILDSHPLIETVIEEPTVMEMGKAAISNFPDGYPSGLSTMTMHEIKRLRKIYFDKLSEYVPFSSSKIIIDQMPLDIIRCGLIYRIFPNAKFIITLRHPYDVCLSCFMQNFNMNSATVNMTSLKDIAVLYSKVMDLWGKYIELLPIQYHIIKYESVIADFEGEIQGLLDFLQVSWDDSILDFNLYAKKKGYISTPSYRQVTHKVYKNAMYRWTYYREHLAPIFEILKPYVEYFEYES